MQQDSIRLADIFKFELQLPLVQSHMESAFNPKVISRAVSRLESNKILWVVAPWDCYGDEFFAVLQEKLAVYPRAWLRVNFYNYIDFSNFINSASGFEKIRLDVLLEHLKVHNTDILVLDNVAFNRSATGRTYFDEALSVSKYILSQSPDTRVVLRSRSISQTSQLEFEYLGPMDEADCNKFTLGHPLRGNLPEISLAAGEIYRLSMGSPGVIDSILAKLSFTRLSEIAVQSSDFAINNVDLGQINTHLSGRIDLLKTEQPCLHKLLCVFSVFPYGEDITHIRNIFPDAPFYPMQSAELVRLGLLNAVEHSFFAKENSELPKVIVASYSVVEYLRASCPETFMALTDRALALYFGKGWRQGDFKLGQSFSQETLRQYDFSILNASYLLRRVLKDAVLKQDGREIQNALGVINFYTARLDKICRYREICGFCVMIEAILKEVIRYNGAVETLFRYANAMRMLGEFDKCLVLFQYLVKTPLLLNDQVARIKLQLSLVFDELDDGISALNYAKEVLSIAAKGPTYYHANSILICKSKAKDTKIKLKRLQKKCKDESHFIAANNISIRISTRFDNLESRRELYRNMSIEAMQQGDTYNHVKATVRYVDLSLKGGYSISKFMVGSLKTCYDYVRSQRLEELFRSSHESLWKIIAPTADLFVLGRLTVLGSKTFRILQDEASEAKYIKELLSVVGGNTRFLPEPELQYIEWRMENLNILPSAESGVLRFLPGNG